MVYSKSLFFIPQFISDWWNRKYANIMAGNDNEKKPLPPGSLGWPIVGETLKFLWQGSNFWEQKFKEFGNIFKTHILGSPTVRVSGADQVRTLIERERDQLDMKWPTTVNILMGPKSLPTVVGPEHPSLKKHLQTGFTPIRLADYLPCVQQLIQEHLQHWIDLGQQKKPILGYPSCEDLTADIMLELVLGCRKEDDKDGKVRAAFRDISHNLFTVPVKIPFSGFSRAVNARKVILEFVEAQMSEKENKKEHVSMMDILLSLHGPEGSLDDDKVKDNSVGILLAGSASTSGALTCLILLLWKHPEVMEKVREELKSAGLLDSDAELNYSLLQKLEYVQCVVKESLRCLPPVGGCFRQSYNEMEIDQYRIPKDWTVLYSIRNTHEITSKQIPDGDVFRPSRWLSSERNEESENASAKKSPPLDTSSCNYIPFGSGPRMCLGRYLAQMIMQVFIVELALGAKWKVVNPDSPLVYLPITKPKDDLPVIFEKL